MGARVLSVLAILACASSSTNRPIVGILTLPNDVQASAGHSYFAASYVKWLESGGARVVPIPYDATAAATNALLKQINGALFTGGAAAFFTASGAPTIYATTASLIFQESVAAAAAGEAWPLWGTCLGFELIGVLGANFSRTVLTPGWDSENLTVAVDWTADAATSRLWGPLPDVRATFANTSNPVAINMHQEGISPAAIAASPPLAAAFTVLGTSRDRSGKVFVASMESKLGHIYATQFHPEKPQYEWTLAETAINHGIDSLRANFAPSLYLVDVARRNSRAFATLDAETAALIYSYAAVDTRNISGFEQVYFFPRST